MKPKSSTTLVRPGGAIIRRKMVNKFDQIKDVEQEEEESAAAALVQQDQDDRPEKLNLPLGSVVKGLMAVKMTACLQSDSEQPNY